MLKMVKTCHVLNGYNIGYILSKFSMTDIEENVSPLYILVPLD